MKETLEKLWNEYLLDNCAMMDTEEERVQTKKVIALHKEAEELLTQEQKAAVERYAEALCDLDSLLARKAFLKGCEFSVSFFSQAQPKSNPF